jgi:hypothetical protein
LERVLEQTGVAGKTTVSVPALLGDYEWRALETPWLRKSAAGLAGLCVIYGVCLVSAWWLRRRTAVS